MDASASVAPAATEILCKQCGAVLHVETGSLFVVCEFCNTTNYVDKSQVVLHYAVRPTIRDNDAEAALRRWMAGNATVKDLDKKATIEKPTYELFPMWMIRVKREDKETVYLEPAAAISVSELKQMTVPAADLEPFDHTMDSSAITPTVPYEAMMRWLQDDHKVQREQVREVSLVHLPIYVFKYDFGGRRYTAIVDAATSRVFANIFPAKWEVPYMTIASVGCLAYFCVALLPVAGYMMEGGAGLGIGIVAYIVAAVVVAAPLFGAALYVSSRV